MPKKKERLLDGTKWAASHQRTIDSLLFAAGRESVKVESKGSQFYNQANWTGRMILADFCEWLRINRNRRPTEYEISHWVYRANNNYVDRKIVIASTPAKLPKKVAKSLLGGGYHEDLHELLSCQREVQVSEILLPLMNIWDQYEDKGIEWSKLTGPIMIWSNIIEDIRIERRGSEDYPGIRSKLVDLQDFVLEMEVKGRAEQKDNPLGHRATPKNEELSVICGTFRDVGLGYKSPLQMKVLAQYKERSKEAFSFVTEGPLKPFLKQAINMSKEDDLGCMWLAMHVVANIVLANKAAKEEPAPTRPQPPNNNPPREVDQADAYGDDEENGGGEQVISKKPPIFKVGDKAKLKVGPHRGKTVVITYAGLPDRETGVQELEMELEK